MRVTSEAEVAEQNADKQDPCGADGDALEFESSQIQADCNHCGEEQDGMRNTSAQEQISHK